MKRPFPIYLVAVWLVLMVAANSKRLISLLHCQEPLFSQLSGIIDIIGIIWAVMLIKLNVKSIYNASALFILLVIGNVLTNLYFFFYRSSVPPEFQNTRFVIGLFLVMIFNIASFWYLVRPSFRKFAKEYVAEIAKEKAAENQAKAYRKQSQSIK